MWLFFFINTVAWRKCEKRVLSFAQYFTILTILHQCWEGTRVHVLEYCTLVIFMSTRKEDLFFFNYSILGYPNILDYLKCILINGEAKGGNRAFAPPPWAFGKF